MHYSGSIGQSGFASHSYENKGCVYVPVKPKEGDDQVQPDVADKLSGMTSSRYVRYVYI